uniref:Uncharacterized protein LOC111123118 n=1 Tax=Crassostrea virginica TaxID=6565 RepID=A0A8B8CYQ1_CRAVI|nr:uncharacterized protein LOC111123118 [Crassostrea virginica]
MESSSLCPTYAILHSDIVHANSTLVLAFDYWTVGTGSMSFDVIDVDTDASYFLMADWGYSGRWKSYNVTIPAGANIMYLFTGVTGGPLDEGEPRYGFSPEFGAVAVDNVRLTVKQ